MDRARVWELAEAQRSFVVAARRHLHQHPELSLKEQETAAFIAERLREVGYEPKTGIGEAGTGLTAMLEGSLPGPTAASSGSGIVREKTGASSLKTARFPAVISSPTSWTIRRETPRTSSSGILASARTRASAPFARSRPSLKVAEPAGTTSVAGPLLGGAYRAAVMYRF